MLNEDASGGRRYQDQVPAVARAVRVLERLAASSESRGLADLARELEIGPSSLLAILTTLRHAGLVARTPSGQYQVGPGLAALGAAAACKLRPCERFATIADTLVAATGETALLWIRHEDAFVLAAAREGTWPLRYVPSPGLRLRADATRLADLVRPPAVADAGAGSSECVIVEEELLPGIWTVAVPLPVGADEHACLALAGPRDRLTAPGVRAALLATAGHADVLGALDPAAPAATAPARAVRAPTSAGTAGAVDPGAFVATASGPIEGAELDAFLGQGLVANLSYLADDGYPTTVPLWYAWDGAAFWLASRPGSEWAEHVRADPRVSLAVSESTPPLRRVLARGLLVEVADPAGARWAEIEGQLAARYAGFDAAREPATAGKGRLLQLTPERLIAWRGLLRHPKLPPGPDRPGSTAWRHLG